MKHSSAIADICSILPIIPAVRNNKTASTLCNDINLVATVMSYEYAINSYSELDETEYETVMTNAVNDFIIAPIRDVIVQKALCKFSGMISKRW